MNKFKSISLCLFFILGTCCNYANAQTKKNEDSAKSYFKFTGSYLSNSVYNGRQDSLITPYITPTFGYYDKAGFYISGSASYLASAGESRIDVFYFDIGYDVDFTDRFSGSFYADKSFYNQTSTAIESAVKGYIGGSLSYDLNFFQVNGGADIMISTQADFALNFGLVHAFKFDDGENKFRITPSVLTNMSTLHFYEGYTDRKVGKKNRQLPNLVSTTSTTTVLNNNFTLMDYEFSVPISYETKKISLFFTPTFAIPQNPIYTTTTTVNKLKNGISTSQTFDSTPLSERKLENVFYAEIGFYIKF